MHVTNASGLINTINPDIKVAIGARRLYELSWLTGTGISALVYYVCCAVIPPPGMNRHFEEVEESGFVRDMGLVGDVEASPRGSHMAVMKKEKTGDYHDVSVVVAYGHHLQRGYVEQLAQGYCGCS
ncbi:uracil permease [Cryptotrichosporon argae]